MESVNEYLRRIGSVGGRKRMASLTPEQRKKLASKAGKRSGKVRGLLRLAKDQ